MCGVYEDLGWQNQNKRILNQKREMPEITPRPKKRTWTFSTKKKKKKKKTPPKNFFFKWGRKNPNLPV